MSKKVAIISTSMRNNSNSDALAREFERGAKDAGHSVEFISLQGKKIDFCVGCFSCHEKGHCVIDDDAIEIERKVVDSDVVVFASPIYYYEMSGQMKTLIDRLNAMYTKDYKFRDVYFLTTSTENGEHVAEYAIGGVKGFVACYKKSQYKGCVYCGGVDAPGDIKGNPKLTEAYEMGKNI